MSTAPAPVRNLGAMQVPKCSNSPSTGTGIEANFNPVPAVVGSMAAQFSVGETFESFEQLFKKENFVELWKRDTRTIAAARKRGVDRPLSPCLKYYEVKYCCVHGGQAFKPRGQGQRCTS